MARTKTHRQPRTPFAGVPDIRRRNMAAIKSKDTAPELAVRGLLHGMGYRYRLHDTGLPGKPDLVFPARRKIVEVRGCWWHGCACQAHRKPVGTRPGYWGPKIEGNIARDARNMAALRAAGWEVLEVWECAVRRGGSDLAVTLTEFLGPRRPLQK